MCSSEVGSQDLPGPGCCHPLPLLGQGKRKPGEELPWGLQSLHSGITDAEQSWSLTMTAIVPLRLLTGQHLRPCDLTDLTRHGALKGQQCRGLHLTLQLALWSGFLSTLWSQPPLWGSLLGHLLFRGSLALAGVRPACPQNPWTLQSPQTDGGSCSPTRPHLILRELRPTREAQATPYRPSSPLKQRPTSKVGKEQTEG